jgi:hypothetical protein
MPRGAVFLNRLIPKGFLLRGYPDPARKLPFFVRKKKKIPESDTLFRRVHKIVMMFLIPTSRFLIASFDFSKRHEAILEGKKAASEALPHIMKIVTQLRNEGGLE